MIIRCVMSMSSLGKDLGISDLDLLCFGAIAGFGMGRFSNIFANCEMEFFFASDIAETITNLGMGWS